MQKTILITGVSGFLGSHLALRLCKKFNVIGLLREGSNLWRFEGENHSVRFIQNLKSAPKIDYIIHTAANYGRDGESVPQIIEANLLLATRLLDFAKSAQIRAFINCDTLQNPLLSPYCLAKSQTRAYFGYFPLQIINVKIEHLFGPKDDRRKFACWLIEELIAGRDVALSAGSQLRDFTYIEDAILAFERIILALDSLDKNAEFELGSGVSTRLRDFIEMIFRLYNDLAPTPTQSRLFFGAKPLNPNENAHIRADISALEKLGYAPQSSLESALRATVEYYLAKNRKRGGARGRFNGRFAAGFATRFNPRFAARFAPVAAFVFVAGFAKAPRAAQIRFANATPLSLGFAANLEARFSRQIRQNATQKSAPTRHSRAA